MKNLKKYLGAQIGFMEVLHTWGQTLVYHPHIHGINYLKKQMVKI